MRRFLGIVILAIMSVAAHTVAAEQISPDGATLAAHEHYPEAIAWYRAEQKREPRAPQPAAGLAKVYAAEGNLAEALLWADKASRLAPREARYQLLMAQIYLLHLKDAGRLASMRTAGRVRRAAIHAVQLAPGSAAAHFAAAQLFVAAPGIAGGSRVKLDHEIATLKKLDPARAEQVEAMEALVEKDYKAMGRHLRAAAAVDAGPQAAYAYGMFLLNRKGYADAAAVFELGMRKHPSFSNNYYGFGLATLRGKLNLGKGIAALKRYLAMPHSDWRDVIGYKWAHYRLGTLYSLIGNKANAVSQYRLAIAADPAFDEPRKALAALHSSP